MLRRILTPILATFLTIAVVANVWAAQQSYTLAPGDSLHVTCMTSITGAVGADTADLVCATLVPTATMTMMPTSTNTPPPAELTGWHPPTDHEHGDAPPQWATDFSQTQFGHGIVYGGDEASSPMEASMKEHVFKGITVNTVAGGNVYLRYHAGSNPADRAARYHSFELYYRDTSGAISFWQGWYDTGDPNSTSARCPRRTPPLPCEQQRPIILVTDATSIQQGIRSEQWYMFGQRDGGWSWDLGITIVGSTTVYHVGENATAMDQTTWTPTGDLGLRRRSDGFWYLGRGGGGTTLTGWLCATPTGTVTSRGSQTCSAGALPNYIAPTIAADARDDGFGNRRVEWLTERTFPGGAGIRLPN